MAQYIDKSALVAEIESKKKCAQILGDNAITGSMQQFYDGMKQGFVDTLSFIDTLEVKEVDLEKEYDRYYEQERHIQTFKLAKHFFELGLKTQYSSINIPNIDVLFEEDGINPNSKDVKLFKECYYTALEKLKEKTV